MHQFLKKKNMHQWPCKAKHVLHFGKDGVNRWCPQAAFRSKITWISHAIAKQKKLDFSWVFLLPWQIFFFLRDLLPWQNGTGRHRIFKSCLWFLASHYSDCIVCIFFTIDMHNLSQFTPCNSFSIRFWDWDIH